MGIDPQNAARAARGVKSGEGAHCDGVIAAEDQRDRPGLGQIGYLRRNLGAGSENGRQITGLFVADGSHLRNLGGHVAAVGYFETQGHQAFGQPRVANRRGAHVDPPSGGAEVELGAEDVDSAGRSHGTILPQARGARRRSEFEARGWDVVIKERGTAVVTGASSGIGAATALRLAEEGFDLVIGARRVDRLQDIAQRCSARALPLDVDDPSSVARFAEQAGSVRVLINNAGLASGLESVAEIDEARIQQMWETNVMGAVRVTKALFKPILDSGDGHIVNVSSIAGFETYPGGAGYTASKHAVRAITHTLRQELVGQPVRVTEISPGHVDTEFALVRFDQDAERAAKTYEGFTPLSPVDVADCIAWAVTRPPNVNIDEIVVRSRAQATATLIARD